jgi:hypothetical protein
MYQWQRLDRLEHGMARKGLRPGESPGTVRKWLDKKMRKEVWI